MSEKKYTRFYLIYKCAYCGELTKRECPYGKPVSPAVIAQWVSNDLTFERGVSHQCSDGVVGAVSFVGVQPLDQWERGDDE